MTKLNRKLWVGLFIPVAMTIAGVVGGIEWAFASLGAMVLISIPGIGIYVLAKTLRCSGTSLKGGYPKFGRKSALSFDGNDSPHFTYRELDKALPISKEDKKLIMAHIDRLFETGWEQSLEESTEAVPISEQDKRLIMAHIDKLFETGWEQRREMLS